MKKQKEDQKNKEKNKEVAAAPSPILARTVVKHLRISPRKMRLVIDTVRFQSPEQAFRILMTLKQKAARMVEKALKSAAANAKVLGLREERLYISDVRADGGPVMKRFMARSMGRADRILKRTTHLSLTLKEGNKIRLVSLAPDAEKSEESKPAKTNLRSKLAAKLGSKKKAAGATA